MLKKALTVLALVLCSVCPALAEGEAYSDSHAVSYYVNLGEGNGAVVIFGDNNVVYLPEQQECSGALAVQVGDGWLLTLPETELQLSNGVAVKYEQLVLFIDAAGITSVVYAEQE